MTYHILPLTMTQIRQGALGFQRVLTTALLDSAEIKVYSASPFDLEERRRMKDRFGGDIVYFFNDEARTACRRLGHELHFIAEIDEDELPRRLSLFVGIPSSNVGAHTGEY